MYIHNRFTNIFKNVQRNNLQILVSLDPMLFLRIVNIILYNYGITRRLLSTIAISNDLQCKDLIVTALFTLSTNTMQTFHSLYGFSTKPHFQYVLFLNSYLID